MNKKAAFDFTQLLHKVLSILQHARLILILSCIGALGGVIIYSYTTPVYYSRSLLSWQVFGLPFHDESEGKTDSVSYYNLWRDLKIQLEAEQLLKDTAVRMKIARKEDDMDVVKGIIRISRILYRDHNTLVIEVFATNPAVVRDFPVALVETYQEHQAQLRKEHREKAVEKYLTEIDQLKSKINEELKKRLDFERESQMVTLTIRQERLLKLPAEIERCRAQLKRMDEIRANFEANQGSIDSIAKLSLLSAYDKEWSEDEKAKTGEVVKRAPAERSPFSQATVAPTQVNMTVVGPQLEEGSEPWRKLEKEQRSLKEDIRQQSQKYLPGHEIMVKLEGQLRDVEHRLQAEFGVATQRFDLEYARVKERLPQLEAQLPEYYDTLKQYEQFRNDYSLLAKGEEDWSKAHADLSKKIKAIQFGDQKQQMELIFGSYEALDDTNPISPTPRKAMMIAAALMIALGLGIPIGIEFINSTVSRLPQLESRLNVRGLGMVPRASPKLLEEIFRSPALGAKVPNFLLECFRVIRSNIILHPVMNGKSQVIAITSARPSEGKSTMAANLSWAFFSMGEKTLLVDVDLRRGRIHEILELDNSEGLSNYFSGESSAEDIIQTTNNPNLDVVTRGGFVNGASEYLCRDVFEDLVAEWRQKYDRVILDCPPVLGLSETIATQRVADGVVVVVRAESTKMTEVETCIDQLKRGSAGIFGFVLNRLDLDKPSNHYYYYYSSPYYYANADLEIDEQAVHSPRRQKQPKKVESNKV